MVAEARNRGGSEGDTKMIARRLAFPRRPEGRVTGQRREAWPGSLPNRRSSTRSAAPPHCQGCRGRAGGPRSRRRIVPRARKRPGSRRCPYPKSKTCGEDAPEGLLRLPEMLKRRETRLAEVGRVAMQPDPDRWRVRGAKVRAQPHFF